MRRKFGIKGGVAKGKDPYNILASNILGRQVSLTEKGRDILLKLVLGLDSRENIVLTFLYGQSKPYSQRRIGDILRVTSARVGQIEQKAMRRLRHSSRIRRLKPHIRPVSEAAG